MADSAATLLRMSMSAAEVAKVLSEREEFFAGQRQTEPRLWVGWGTHMGPFKPLPLPAPADISVWGHELPDRSLAMFVCRNHGRPAISARVRVVSPTQRFNGIAHIVAEMVNELPA